MVSLQSWTQSDPGPNNLAQSTIYTPVGSRISPPTPPQTHIFALPPIPASSLAQVLARPNPYAAHFTATGMPIEGTTLSHLQTPILPNSRGVFLKHIPAFTTLASLAPQLRGGRIERIDFHNHQHRTCVGVFFVLAAHAEAYIKHVRRLRLPGAYWAGVGSASPVEAIPRAKGGHEPVKANVARAIRDEGATRVLVIDGLPAGTDAALLVRQVQRQSAALRVAIESVDVDGARGRAVVRMASVGTALGARMRLQGVAWYRGCRFSFGEDECEGDLTALGERWEAERRRDCEGARSGW